MRTTVYGQAWVAALAATVSLLISGCSGGTPVPSPDQLPDACGLLTQTLRDALVDGAPAEPWSSQGPLSATSHCTAAVDPGGDALSATLEVEVALDGFGNMYDASWQRERCEEIGAVPDDSGPGDTSCFATRKEQDLPVTRLSGYAWVSDDMEARVSYVTFGEGALSGQTETHVRELLVRATEALPSR